MLEVFQRHALPGAALLFTSGDEAGERIGAFEGKPLYHSSLAADEYRQLLHQCGFGVIRHIAYDPACGDSTDWLAKKELG